MIKSLAVTKAHRFVGVTFGEFAALHASSEMRLLRSRLVDIPLDTSASSLPVRDGDSVRMLMRRLPALSLDDEEGVLILRLMSGQLPEDEDDSQLVRIPMDRIDCLVPLTSRAKAILTGRLAPYGIAPGDAWFEAAFQALSYQRRVESSVSAGHDLVGMFAPAEYRPRLEKLVAPAARALAMKDFEGVVPDNSEEYSDADTCVDTWVSGAFRWTRHTPDDYGALNHLFDAGTILRTLLQKRPVEGGSEGALVEFRGIATKMKKELGNQARIDEILGFDSFVPVAQALQDAIPDVFPAGLSALVLYLRWKERFQKSDLSIDIDSISADLDLLKSSSYRRDDIFSALWLLGFYAGSGAVSYMAYAADPERHSWFRGTPLQIKRIALVPESGNTNSPVDAQISVDEEPAAPGATAPDDKNGEGAASESAPIQVEELSVSAGLFPDRKDYVPSRGKEYREDENAIREALANVRQTAPHLEGEALYRHVALNWFDYKRLEPKFLKRVERIDTRP